MRLVEPSSEELSMLRTIASIQFRGIPHDFIPDDILLHKSPSTMRIRMIFWKNKPFLSLRASDYYLIPHILAGYRLNEYLPIPLLRVVVSNKYSRFIARGGNVFCPHIVFADPSIRPREEIVVVDEDYRVLAVGRALLPGWAMTYFNRGEAVRVRESIE